MARFFLRGMVTHVVLLTLVAVFSGIREGLSS